MGTYFYRRINNTVSRTHHQQIWNYLREIPLAVADQETSLSTTSVAHDDEFLRERRRLREVCCCGAPTGGGAHHGADSAIARPRAFLPRGFSTRRHRSGHRAPILLAHDRSPSTQVVVSIIVGLGRHRTGCNTGTVLSSRKDDTVQRTMRLAWSVYYVVTKRFDNMHSGKNGFGEECERRAGGINIDWRREPRLWTGTFEANVDFLPFTTATPVILSRLSNPSALDDWQSRQSSAQLSSTTQSIRRWEAGELGELYEAL